MFSKIDSFLIMWAQWFRRQLELYTKTEGNDLYNFFLLLFKNSILAMLVITPFTIFLEGPWGVIDLILILAFSLEYLRYRLVILRQKTENSSLPQEIITRKTTRWIMIFSSLFIVVFVIPPLILIILSTGRCTTSTLFEIFICGTFPIKLCLELVLCTTSLPPGEKERRTQEKEMRKMQPALIRN